jgi:tetratricopeptide (TPR) repeat protein
LLLERSADANLDLWYRQFLDARSSGELADRQDCRYAEPAVCSGLDDNSLGTIFSEVFSEYGFQAPIERALSLYREIDPQGRPLLATAAAEAIVHGKDIERIRHWSAANLVEAIVEREFAAWRAAGIDEAHVNLVTYATIRNGCPKPFCELLASQGMNVPSPAARNDRWLHQMLSFGARRGMDEISPIVPDMLGEWFVLERLAGRLDIAAPNQQLISQDTLSLIRSAWYSDSDSNYATALFILRALNDFASHDAIPKLFSDDLARTRAGMFALLVADALPALIRSRRADLAEQLIDRIDRLIEESQHDQLVAIGLSNAIFNRGATYAEMGENQRAVEDFTRVTELPSSSAEQVAQALYNRAVRYRQMGEDRRAIEDYTRVIELPGAPAEQVAKALFNRGGGYRRMGENQRAIEDYTRIIELPGAPAEQVAQALYSRGVRYREMGESHRAIEDYTRLIELPGAPAEQVALALNNRGVRFADVGENRRAVEDFTRAIELPETPAEHVAKAFNNRGARFAEMGENQRAVEDFTRAIELPGAVAEQVAGSLISRGFTYGQMGENQRAVEDFTRVIELPGTLVEQIAKALFIRGRSYQQMGQNQRAIADYTRVIELPGASAEQIAHALFNRGVRYGDAGESQRAIEDFTGVIELPGAPAESIAMALVNRGVIFRGMGDAQREIEDYTRVIELPGAQPEQVARAHNARGFAYGEIGDSQSAVEDFARVDELPGAPAEHVATALWGTCLFGEFELTELCSRLKRALPLAQSAEKTELVVQIVFLAQSLGCD